MNVIEKMKERIELLEELAETGEEFEMSGFKHYKFKYIDGEFIAVAKEDFVDCGASKIIFDLDLEIVREPWKPKLGEGYYVVDIGELRGYCLRAWVGDRMDEGRYNLGIIAKTEKEIKEKSKKILELIKNNG